MLKQILIQTSLVLVLLASWAPTTPIKAQEDGDPVSIGTYRVIESKALGETRRLLISLPRGYDGSAISYPVLYHTYGSYISPYYADAYISLEELGNAARIPQVILVGIDNIDRYRDLRPVDRQGQPTRIEQYVEFLESEVFPYIEKNYRTSDYRIVAGPQAGAVFGTYALTSKPDMFDAYILNNPFVSAANDIQLFESADKYFSGDGDQQKFCCLTFDSQNSPPANVAKIYRFADLSLPAQANGFRLWLNDVDTGNSFIEPLGLRTGLKNLFNDYYLPRENTFSGLASIKIHYQKLSDQYGYTVAPAELVMTFSADKLSENGEITAAVEILEFQTEMYPGMVNAWWRLAGIAADRQENKKAIELFRKCEKLNPGMANFVKRRIEDIEKR